MDADMLPAPDITQMELHPTEEGTVSVAISLKLHEQNPFMFMNCSYSSKGIAGVVYVQAGAGIVADSVPALEWDEPMNKARGMLRAIAMVESQ